MAQTPRRLATRAWVALTQSDQDYYVAMTKLACRAGGITPLAINKSLRSGGGRLGTPAAEVVFDRNGPTLVVAKGHRKAFELSRNLGQGHTDGKTLKETDFMGLVTALVEFKSPPQEPNSIQK